MGTIASVVTAQGSGAVATVLVKGSDAAHIVQKFLNTDISRLTPGATGLFTLSDNGTHIDHLLIGREDDDCFALHCHGNSLIVDTIMEMLKAHGATCAGGEQMYAAQIHAATIIEAEATLAAIKAKTLEGAKLLYNQINGGLGAKAIKWQKELRANPAALSNIQNEIQDILNIPEQARIMIHGATVVLAGPPNSGKSTLLNLLCRQDKSIVADFAGTTRDWVSAPAKIGNIYAELIDTAGLSETIIANDIDGAAQRKSRELLDKADLILLVLDTGTQTLPEEITTWTHAKKTIAVLNKIDQGQSIDLSLLPGWLGANAVSISAKTGANIEHLTKKIALTLGVHAFDLKQPVCFTPRQHALLANILQARSQSQSLDLISGLLNNAAAV